MLEFQVDTELKIIYYFVNDIYFSMRRAVTYQTVYFLGRFFFFTKMNEFVSQSKENRKNFRIFTPRRSFGALSTRFLSKVLLIIHTQNCSYYKKTERINETQQNENVRNGRLLNANWIYDTLSYIEYVYVSVHFVSPHSLFYSLLYICRFEM